MRGRKREHEEKESERGNDAWKDGGWRKKRRRIMQQS